MSLDPNDPRLLDSIKETYLDPKIKGEDKNKLLIFLICASSSTQNPLSAIIKGPSGAGKSHLVNKVLDIFRAVGNVIGFSRITGAYLENMAKRQDPIPKPVKPGVKDYESKADFNKAVSIYEDKLAEYVKELQRPRRIDLSGKILFVDELRGIQNAQAPKLLISEGRLRLGTVINNEPVEIEVKGTPVIITTTTLAVLDDPEFENRIIPIQIDETEEQTKQVLEFEAGHYEDPAQDLTEYAKTHALIEFLGNLKPYGIANPYARKLAEDYPKKNIEARRDYPKLMNLCNVVTWLYQNQRVRAAKGLDLVFVTDLKDIERVKDLALAPLRESLAGISEKEDAILHHLQGEMEVTENPETLVERPPSYRWLTVKDIYSATRKQTRRGEQWTRDHVKRLVGEGYIEEDQVKPNRFQYRYSELQPETLEIKTEEYSRQVAEWAQEHGYKITGTPGLDWAITQGQAKPAPLERLEPESSPKSEFGKPALPAEQFGLVQRGNGHVSQSKPSVGIKCPRCNITWPDQPSFDNHLSTYKHD